MHPLCLDTQNLRPRRPDYPVDDAVFQGLGGIKVFVAVEVMLDLGRERSTCQLTCSFKPCHDLMCQDIDTKKRYLLACSTACATITTSTSSATA